MIAQPLSNPRGDYPSGSCIKVIVCTLAGLAAFYFFTLRPVMSHYAAQSWQETRCTVLSSRVGRETAFRLHLLGRLRRIPYSVGVIYTYSFEGRSFQSNRYRFFDSARSQIETAKIVARYPPGASVPCWFDPVHPEQAVLNREISADWLIGLLTLPLILLGLLAGAGMIIRWVQSRKRRKWIGDDS